tara:strand:+ start:1226 stop:2101 length:876 start_codon:yes stop_codon:yes gene_type:complete
MKLRDKLDGIFTARDIYKDVKSLYDGKTGQLYSTGFAPIDELIKLPKPSFTVITGSPNSGKSSFVFDMAVRMFQDHDFKWLVFSPEHSLAMSLKRVIEKDVEKPFDEKWVNRMSEQEMIDSMAKMQDSFFFIDKVGDAPDIDWILERAQYVKDNYGLDGLIIDPYNEIQQMNVTAREDMHISNLISKIKRFNRENGCLTFMIAHPTKSIKNKETGNYEVNSAYDISGSANWNNKCDFCIIVNREFEKERTEIRVTKVREISHGEIGSRYLKFNPKTMCYHGEDSIVFRKHD